MNKQFKSKLHEYFIKKLGAFDYRHGWMKSRCPYCGREKKFGINISSNRCNCFRCGEHPSLMQLVMHLEHVDSYTEAYKIVDSRDASGYVFKEDPVELKEKKPVYLPEGFKSITLGSSQLARSARSYIENRGFNLQEAANMGWGYCNSGPLIGYIILPFSERGQLRYYNARLFLGNGPKYSNPDISVTGVGKSMILYNHDALYMYKMVYICEGVFNAATMGKNGIASGGKNISRYQINEILKSPVQRVIIILDSDAKDKAIDLALKLVNYKKVKVIFMPEGRDVNDIGRSATLKIVRKTPYMNYNDLLKLKQDLI